jgi:cytochrome c oxidase subunit 2|tara:strand:+ start:19 stop:672 length:654 start_codon:yes stop_codon:yes gene_type:complete
MMQMLYVAAAAAAEVIAPIAYPADRWDRIFDIWIALAVVIYLIVAVPIIYFMVKYRYKEGENEIGADEHGNMGLEILWTIIPTIIVIYLAFQSAAIYTAQRTAPADSLLIRADAMMWAWQFDYPNGKSTIGNLTIPVDQPIKLELTSRDVIHSFYVPAAKTMEDAVPGRVTNLWFQFNETGEFISFCREYCGTAHAYMNATINVVTQEEYDEWLKSS